MKRWAEAIFGLFEGPGLVDYTLRGAETWESGESKAWRLQRLHAAAQLKCSRRISEARPNYVLKKEGSRPQIR